MTLATLQPYSTLHNPLPARDSARVPYATDRLLLPNPPTADRSVEMSDRIMDTLYPIHSATGHHPWRITEVN